MGAFLPRGTQLKIGDGGGPETFTTIAEVLDIDIDRGERERIDVTNMDTPIDEIDELAGAPSDLTVRFGINWDPQEGTHNATGLLGDWAANTLRNFQLVYPPAAGSLTSAFAAYVVSFAENLPVRGAGRANLTLRVKGGIPAPA